MSQHGLETKKMKPGGEVSLLSMPGSHVNVKTYQNRKTHVSSAWFITWHLPSFKPRGRSNWFVCEATKDKGRVEEERENGERKG